MTEKTWGDSRERSKSRARKRKMTMWQNPAEYYCRVCRRQFDKLKALCGHMRAHGDRSWQGLLPPPDHHNPRPSPPTYEASTSTGMRGGLGINFQREPQVLKVFASLKFDLNMLPATEPQEKVLDTLKLEMQAAPEPQEKVLAPEADLDSHVKFNFDLNEAPEEDGAEPQEKVLAPEADLDSHVKFNFDLNEAPEEDGANDY